MASTTFTVRGHKVRTQSHFRYQIVCLREAPLTVEVWDGLQDGETVRRGMGRTTAEWWLSEGITRSISPRPETYVAYARIEGRSDSYTRAKERAARMSAGPGGVVVVIDATTGEEV